MHQPFPSPACATPCNGWEDFFPLPHGVCATCLCTNGVGRRAKGERPLPLATCPLTGTGYRARDCPLHLNCDRGPLGSVRDLDDRMGVYLPPHQSAVQSATPCSRRGSRNRLRTRVDDYGMRCMVRTWNACERVWVGWSCGTRMRKFRR